MLIKKVAVAAGYESIRTLNEKHIRTRLLISQIAIFNHMCGLCDVPAMPD